MKRLSIALVAAFLFGFIGCTLEEIKVESITIDQKDLTLTEGESVVLTATVLPENAADKSIKWSSSNESVVMVSSSGKVVAMSAGRASVKAEVGDKYNLITITVVPKAIPVTDISLTPSTIRMRVGESLTIVPEVIPLDATNKSITWSSSDESIVVVNSFGQLMGLTRGNCIIRASANDNSGVAAECEVIVWPALGSLPYGAVDLGLSVYWATCNLGASKPEGYGDYYAWGETKTKNKYSLDTYKWYNTLDETYTKYISNSYYGLVDNKMTLEENDDVAHFKLGDMWRIPTITELDELREQCTWTWTTENGICGRKVTGPNGNSIFLPAAGFRDNTGLRDRGNYGFYWSASISYTSGSYAFDVGFGSNFVYRYEAHSRANGFSVRPVSE